ncbi:MAG: single-stranded DNA-binding protein [Leptospirales bacterium]
MANYNRTTLLGNLTADPEKRFTKDGAAVTNFTVAVNGPPSKDPDREEEVLFMPCVTFGKTAEAAGKYLSKGDPVLVDGRLRTDRWESEGEKRIRTVLRVGLVQFLGRKGTTEGDPEGAADGDIPY